MNFGLKLAFLVFVLFFWFLAFFWGGRYYCFCSCFCFCFCSYFCYCIDHVYILILDSVLLFLFLHDCSVLCQGGIKNNFNSPLFMLWDFVFVLHKFAYVHVCIIMCVVVIVNTDDGDVVLC